MGILDFFSGTPRGGQAAACLEVERLWHSHDVFVIVAPTGSGKTKVALAIARWATAKRGGAGHTQAWYGHPNNVLLGQVVDGPDARGVGTLGVMESYECMAHSMSCSAHKAKCGFHCKPRPGRNYWNDRDACPYVRDLRGARSAKILTTTWHMRMAHKLVPDVAIVDEAHLAERYAAELDEKVVWPHRYGSKTAPRDATAASAWLAQMGGPGSDGPLGALDAVLRGADPTRVLASTERLYFRKPKPALVLSPVDLSRSDSFPWFGAKKTVLLSGTLSPVDVRRFGLTRGGRVAFIDIPSPIPVENRPILVHPVADMSHAHRGRSVRTMAVWLRDELLPAHSGERGVVHATYDVALELRRLGGGPRLVFHDRDSKQETITEWLSTPDDERVLVASGVEEGLDLPGKLGRFQVLTSTPRGNLGDPAQLWLAENDPETYLWHTIRKVVQATGRISRGPEDYGLTILADSSIQRLELAHHLHLFPQYWRDALIS